MRILLAEHSRADAGKMAAAMVDAGIAVDHATCGTQAFEMLQTGSYDAAVLASDLPVMSGLQVLRLMRQSHDGTPVLLLLAEPNAHTRIEALRTGADDVVASILEHEELVARVQAIGRRRRAPVAPALHIDGLVIDPGTKQVTGHGQPFDVTNKEFELLHLLAQRRGSVLSKDALMNHLYGGRDEPEMKIIDVFICKLRKKLQLVGIDNLIGTVWGQGYIMRDSRDGHVPQPRRTAPALIPSSRSRHPLLGAR